MVLIPVIGFALALASVDPAPPDSIRLATGFEGGAYHRYGEAYREALAKEGIEVVLRTTQGTGENLELLAKGEVDLAFVQGGVGTAAAYPELRSLASLYYEPLWVFVPSAAEFRDLRDLAGKRLAIGSEGSGTHPVAKRLLELNGVKAEVLSLGGVEGRAALLEGRIDALFLVGSPEIPLVRALCVEPRVRLLPFKRSEAYSRLVRYLSPVVLSEGVIDLRKNVPASDVPLVAAVSGLAVRGEDFHPALTDVILPVSRRLHEPGGVLEKPGAFPGPHRLDFPLTDEAERYFRRGLPFLHRFMPFWAANLIDRFKVMLLPLLTLALPLFEIVLPVYRLRQRLKVERLYADLRRLEDESSGDEGFAALSDRARGVSLPPSFVARRHEFLLHLEASRTRTAALRPASAQDA